MVSLASATASSASSTTVMGAIGAKISSVHSRESLGTSATTVGRTNGPSVVPPATIFAAGQARGREDRARRLVPHVEGAAARGLAELAVGEDGLVPLLCFQTRFHAA